MSLLWTTAASRTLKSGPDGEAPKGTMVAIVPPTAVAKDLVQEDGETWDNIHVTLAYLPFEDNVGMNFDHLHKVVKDIAALYKPMKGKIGGVGTFNNPDNYVLWASANVPGLDIFRHALVCAIEAEDFTISHDHGFTPHVTLKYATRPFRFMPKIEEHPFPVGEVWVCVGSKWKSYPLGKKS